MKRIIEFFINNHKVSNIIIFILFLSGIFSMLSLQREELPAFNLELLKITTMYPGAGPEDVEINLTNKIEEHLLLIENITKITSVSMESMSIIMIEIDQEADEPDKIKTKIREAILNVSGLPEAVVERPYVQEITASYPMFEIALHGSVSEKKLRLHARDLEEKLRELKGIGAIEKIGYRKREIHINADISKMKHDMVSFNRIIDAIKTRNVRQSGGTVQSYVSEKNVLTLSEYHDPLDVKNVIIRSNYEGFKVRISDICDIKDDFDSHKILYRGNGKPGISFLIKKSKNADIISLSKSIKKLLKEYQENLPQEVYAQEIYDFSVLTETMITIVSNNALIGIFLILIVLFVFLDLQSAIWSAFGIPFVILTTMIVFVLMGITLNMVALGGLMLIIGIVVDDAIVILEKIYTLKHEGIGIVDAAVLGVQQMIVPVSAATFTTIIAFLPVLFIPGIMGRFMEQIPIVVTAALILSMVEAFFFMPVHVSSTKFKKNKNGWFLKIKKCYEKFLEKALQKRKTVLSVYIVLLIFTFTISILFIDFMLEEDINPDYFTIVIEAPEGTSLKKTSTLLPEIEKIVVDSVPKKELKSFTTHIGHHNKSTNYIGMGGNKSNHALITVYLLPASERNITSEEIMEKIKPQLEKIKDKRKFKRLVIELMGFESGKAVEIVYISSDDLLRNKFEKKTVDFLKKSNGVYGIESTNIVGKDEFQFHLDYDKLATMNLSALDVAHTVRTAFEGTLVTSIQRNDETIDFRVRAKNFNRMKRHGILELPVENYQGFLVPIKHFASLKDKKGSETIYHYNGKRSVTISANVDDSKTTSYEVNDLIKKKFGTIVNKTPGIRMKLGGQEEETSISMKGFYFALIIAVFSIYFILVVLFNSYLQPLYIMSIIPFAVAGVFITLLIHNRPLVFISLIGLLGLIGVVVNDTIVLISNLNRVCIEKGKSIKSIIEGASERLRPVILTTLTTFAGLLPTAYGIGGDLPMIRPMILSMAWGLIFCSVVTLGFIPLIFSNSSLLKRQ